MRHRRWFFISAIIIASSACSGKPEAFTQNEAGVMSANATTDFPGGNAIAHVGEGTLLYSTGVVAPASGSGGYPEVRGGLALSLTHQSDGGLIACGLADVQSRGLASGIGRIVCHTITRGGDAVKTDILSGQRFSAPLDLKVVADTTWIAALDDHGDLVVIEHKGQMVKTLLVREASSVLSAVLLNDRRVGILVQTGVGCEWHLYDLPVGGDPVFFSNNPVKGAVCLVPQARVTRSAGTDSAFILAVSNSHTELVTIAPDGAWAQRQLEHRAGRVQPKFAVVHQDRLYFDDGRDERGQPTISITGLPSSGTHSLALPSSGRHPDLRGLFGDPTGVWATLKGEDWVTVNLGDVTDAAGR